MFCPVVTLRKIESDPFVIETVVPKVIPHGNTGRGMLFIFLHALTVNNISVQMQM